MPDGLLSATKLTYVAVNTAVIVGGTLVFFAMVYLTEHHGLAGFAASTGLLIAAIYMLEVLKDDE